MILFFHFICIFTRYIVNSLTKSISQVISDDTSPEDITSHRAVEFFAGRKDYLVDSKYEDGNLRFFPPVYVQRYQAVASILQEEPWRGRIRKVVDFGCAELSFFLYLKRISDIEEILEVDIDEDLLKKFASKPAPLTTDYLSCKRSKPLDVYILAGSISDYDDYLSDVDAVIGIEVIEHLYPETFKKMPYNIFHQIKPSLAIFTTPNADFNVLFTNLVGFRHDDHKFEWTRKEFQEWAQDIVSEYPEYTVSFYGVGPGPEGTEDLGCCTQMAVFQRCDERYSCKRKPMGVHNYGLVRKYKYPFYVDPRSEEEKLLDETNYQLSRLSKCEQFYNYIDNVAEIPLDCILEYVAKWCSSSGEYCEFLTNSGILVKEKEGKPIIIYSEEDLKSNLSEEEYEDDPEDYQCLTENPIEENWDWEPQAENIPEKKVWNETLSETKMSEGAVIDSDISSKFNECDLTDHKTFLQTERKEHSFSRSCNENGVEKEACSEGIPQLTKIPRKRNFAEICCKTPVDKEEKQASQINSKGMVRPHSSYVHKSPRKISKSFSLDSCLENINCEPVEVQAFYLNLISGGALPSRGASSLSGASRRSSSRFIVNDSGSPNSCEKAMDSGYPFSFSPHDTDLTPEQVEELITENEIMASASEDSLSQDEEEPLELDGVQHDVFIDEVVVENGDVANNNRDGEGNNVEGIQGDRVLNQPLILAALEHDPNDNVLMLAPEPEDPFPHWLLNLVELAQRPVPVPLQDEGLGDDSSSEGNLSLDLDEPEPESDFLTERSGAGIAL